MRFVDTNILIYAACPPPNDVAKAERAAELLRTADIALSAQVLQEFYVQATRVTRPGALTHDDARRMVRNLQRFPIQPVTAQVVNNALALRERFQINYWDAAILAAARIAGCNTVYTEDLNDGQDYDGVRVVNPFA